ncbi:MAG TPA: histidine kinase N-terminal domain-containing protein [Mycobacteriales bacterium]|nr:histidine kinase N-terminal domain-containing protein [Mycobacteriales bacterium]
MSTLVRRAAPGLTDDEIRHLHALVADWQILADLSFADLLLLVRVAGADAYCVVAQMRPTTGQTLYQDDLVGATVDAAERFLVDVAFVEGRIAREGDPEWETGVPVRMEAIPVRCADRVVAVISRDTNLASPRVPSQLELTYLQTAGDLAQMIADGGFPFAGVERELAVSPRVGDGLLRLDADGQVVYASPNALSAYRRLGITANIVGEHLGDQGLDERAVTAVLRSARPSESEVECSGAVVLRRGLPLVVRGEVVGALVLVRDVTELRRRERQLISKDATIREIHHRVKNNLQTVAALLRLQSRRLTVPEARAALEESVRRVSSIALVHETLSQSLGPQVAFDGIADKIVAMIGDVPTGDAAVAVRRDGSAGALPGPVATPLALVLVELLQNAVEHAFGDRGSELIVRMHRGDDTLRVEVVDDGGGLPDGFTLESSTRLGLQIVRTLVVSELGGAIRMTAREDGPGTSVVLDVPLAAAPA